MSVPREIIRIRQSFPIAILLPICCKISCCERSHSWLVVRNLKGEKEYINIISNHYIQMERYYGKNAYWTSFLYVQMDTHFIFLQQLLCCADILLEKYPVQQLMMPSSLVIRWNVPNTNIIVNYHILIICNWSGYGYVNLHSNMQMFARCLAFYTKWITLLHLRKVCIFLWYFDRN